MADEKDSKNEEFAPEIGDPQEQETDLLFRAQMGVYNFFMRSWQQLLAVLVLFLAGVLVYSLYSDYQRDQQRDWQAEIAAVTRKMPEDNPLAALTGGLDAQTIAQYKEGARRYEKVAQESQGTASVTAWALAASAWETAGEQEAAMKALQAVLDQEPDGVMAWSAASQLANLKSNSGDIDGALALYQQYAQGEGFIAQHALLEQAILLEAQGRSGEALQLLQQSEAKFQESNLEPQAAEVIQRLKG